MIPGFASLYERLTMKETKPYEKCERCSTNTVSFIDTTSDVYNSAGSTGDHVRTHKDGSKDFFENFNFRTAIARRHVLTLVSTALTWFFL
jgi:hypothetical protein